MIQIISQHFLIFIAMVLTTFSIILSVLVKVLRIYRDKLLQKDAAYMIKENGVYSQLRSYSPLKVYFSGDFNFVNKESRLKDVMERLTMLGFPYFEIYHQKEGVVCKQFYELAIEIDIYILILWHDISLLPREEYITASKMNMHILIFAEYKSVYTDEQLQLLLKGKPLIWDVFSSTKELAEKIQRSIADIFINTYRTEKGQYDHN